MLAIIESKSDIKYIQMLTAATEGATENIEEGLHYWEIYSIENITHLKNWRIP